MRCEFCHLRRGIYWGGGALDWMGYLLFFNIYKKKIQKRHIGERKKEIFAQNKAWVAMMGVSCDDVLYV